MKEKILSLKGIVPVFIIAVISHYLGKAFPAIGGAAFGILFGILCASFFNISDSLKTGIDFASKQILHISIILLGTSINIFDVAKTGKDSFPVIIIGLFVSFAAANIIGKAMGINFKLRNLIGAGTGICGGSAIAAISPVIKADEKEISFSLSTIFLFNIAAVFLFPVIGHLFNMSQLFFGMFAGSAINDTSSVVAAGYIYGVEAGKYATTVKLTRSLMIIPVVLTFAFINRKRENGDSFSIKKAVPWFITGFVIMSMVNTLFHGIDSQLALTVKPIFNLFSEAGKFLIIASITAIGFKTDIKEIRKTSLNPLLLGFATWCAVIISTLAVQLFITR